MLHEETQNAQQDFVPPQEESRAVVQVSGSMNLSEAYIADARRQLELRKQLLAICLTALRSHDVQDFDGRPYIEGEGAARIMAVVRDFKVGEAIFDIKEESNHFFIECALPIEWKGATTIGYGDCSTADPFFVGRDGKGGIFKKHLDRTGGNERLAARLVMGDAKKKARENALSRAVCELLGLKGLKWEDLEALGFKRADAGSKVEYKKGSQGGAVKVDLAGAKNLADGSVFECLAEVLDAKEEKTSNGKDVVRYSVRDATSQGDISMWGKVRDGLKAGMWFEFKDVKVKVAGSRKYFSAGEMKPFEQAAGAVA